MSTVLPVGVGPGGGAYLLPVCGICMPTTAACCGCGCCGMKAPWGGGCQLGIADVLGGPTATAAMFCGAPAGYLLGLGCLAGPTPLGRGLGCLAGLPVPSWMPQFTGEGERGGAGGDRTVSIGDVCIGWMVVGTEVIETCGGAAMEPGSAGMSCGAICGAICGVGGDDME